MTTTFKTATDFRKSLEARLKQKARKAGQDLQRLRRQVAFDRLLARIFSQGDENFVLKGGYAMELRVAAARATKDIDLTCLKRASPSDPIAEVILAELRRLARVDLGDYFRFEIGEAQRDLENAPYGGARYPVSSVVDGRLFVRFQLDVGADAVVDEIETLNTTDWLGYCGIPAHTVRAISIEQQLAEKLHAYTLPQRQTRNTRVKDLIDVVLLIQNRQVRVNSLRRAIGRVFNVRGTHLLPNALQEPPSTWLQVFKGLANECNLGCSMSEAFGKLSQVFASAITSVDQ